MDLLVLDSMSGMVGVKKQIDLTATARNGPTPKLE
jgi:hypothetical protein